MTEMAAESLADSRAVLDILPSVLEPGVAENACLAAPMANPVAAAPAAYIEMDFIVCFHRMVRGSPRASSSVPFSSNTSLKIPDT